MSDIATAAAPRRRPGGRPKGDPAAVRTATIGVRVSATEYAELRSKAGHMGMSPAQWLRAAALSRALPPPPVPAINRAHYAELAKLASNLNQLAKAANTGLPVVVSREMLERTLHEVQGLRLALLGVP